MNNQHVTGDGTDQTEEVQRALDSAGAGGTVILEGNISVTGPLHIGFGVTVESDSGGFVQIKNLTIGD